MRLFCALVAVARLAEGILEDGVLVLTASNFENRVNENFKAGMLVEFYAPWCKHCQQLAPVYAEAARALEDEVVLGKLDAVAHKEIAQKHGVSGYPSLKFFKQGRVVDATNSGREAEALIAAARRLSADRCLHMGDAGAVDAALEKSGVRALAFFKNNRTKAARAFLSAVDEFRYPIDFFIGSSEALKKHAFAEATRKFLVDAGDEGDAVAGLRPPSLGDVPKGPALLLVKPYDERVAFTKIGDGAEGRKAMEKWLEQQMMPLVVPFMPEYVDMIFGGPLQMHAILCVDPKKDFTKERDAFYAAAIANRGKVLHILMFKPPDDDDDDDDDDVSEDEIRARDELRSVLNYLKITTTPAYVVSDMTAATEAEPRGKQVTYDGDVADRAAVLAFQQPYASKAVARKAGLDPKMADIMADPKMQEMIKDPKMSSMFSIMGMPQQLVDVYRAEL